MRHQVVPLLKALHKESALASSSAPNNPSLTMLNRLVAALEAAAERHLTPWSEEGGGEEPTFAAIMVLMQVWLSGEGVTERGRCD